MNILEVHGLHKKFKTGFFLKPVQVLSDVNFSVKKGRVTGFIGANGSGKTTIIKSVLGFIFPDQGEITFFGDKKLSSEVKSRMGFLPERPYFYDFLTGRQFLRFHLNLFGSQVKDFASEEQIEKTLARVGLANAADRKLRNYSKGMLQRAGIAQAILHRPEFLILDEPMSGLDPDGRIEVKNIIREVADQGTTIFFSSHLLHDAEELCQDLVIVRQGRVVYYGPLSEIKAHDTDLERVYYDIARGVK